MVSLSSEETEAYSPGTAHSLEVVIPGFKPVFVWLRCWPQSFSNMPWGSIMFALRWKIFYWKDLWVSYHGSKSNSPCRVFTPISTGKTRQDNLIVTRGQEAKMSLLGNRGQFFRKKAFFFQNGSILIVLFLRKCMFIIKWPKSLMNPLPALQESL